MVSTTWRMSLVLLLLATIILLDGLLRIHHQTMEYAKDLLAPNEPGPFGDAVRKGYELLATVDSVPPSQDWLNMETLANDYNTEYTDHVTRTVTDSTSVSIIQEVLDRLHEDGRPLKVSVEVAEGQALVGTAEGVVVARLLALATRIRVITHVTIFATAKDLALCFHLQDVGRTQ